MRALRALRQTGVLLLASSALWAASGAAAAAATVKRDGPSMSVEAFDNQPVNFNYFAGSDVVMFQDIVENNVYRSADAGVTWDRVDAVPGGSAWVMYMHEYDPTRAYILTQGIQHYRTSDRGKTWDMFQTDAELTVFRSDVLQFHATDPDRIIFNGMDCLGILCQEVAMYTTDGFRSAARFLRGDTAGCWWAKASPLFSTGDDSADKDRTLCIVRDAFAARSDQRLMMSDQFFRAADASGKIQEVEPNLEGGRPTKGIVNLAVVKKYMMVATTSPNTDEMALYVTDDTNTWHRATFPAPHDAHDHRLMQEAYTVLESTDYSIQIDVMTTRPWSPMGIILTSNSNGTYFSENIEHTNRNMMGHVDFEKIAGIQGIFLVNTVDNWRAVEEDAEVSKKILSGITFDDGRTFHEMTADGKRIHLHSVTDLSNVGRVFSSPAPGIVMGIGNTGDYLGSYWQTGNLFVSDNAGVTWTKALDGPHKYEFGDQGSVLVAVKDSAEADVGEISYSLDHGVSWKSAQLPDGLKIHPYIITTEQDSTSLKFALVGSTKSAPGWKVISIDFNGLHEAKCGDGDMEEWHARVDKDGNPTCLMGHKQSYRRRKKTANCFLKQEFSAPHVETTDCDCTDQDFECDFNFAKDADSGKCVQQGPIAAPEGACDHLNPDATFMGTSGWRKIPGNTCKPTRETDEKYQAIERKCSDILNDPLAPITDKVDQKKITFDGDWSWLEKHYLERGESSSSDDETIIVRPRSDSAVGPISVTHDHGKSWTQPDALMEERIIAIAPHHYFKDMVFFITDDKKVLYTPDRGVHFYSFSVPYGVDQYVNPLSFHPDRKDWLLWTGLKCEGSSTTDCYRATSFSRDRGDHWETAARFVRGCEFTGSSTLKYPGRAQEQILCLEREREDPSSDNNPLQLIASNDWFESQDIRETNVKGFATMAEFIMVATVNSSAATLVAHASLDGKTFAEAKFPHGFEVPHQHEYTVLDSSTHAVNLFVTTEMDVARRRGAILKSNSNGTSYVMSVKNVNCNEAFYVDFEKMLGLEGVAVVNIVANADATDGAPKNLQTLITHNDGAQWAYIPAPDMDDNLGGSFPCLGAGDEQCALHLHGYTEKRNHGYGYSSRSAVGIMLAWGNVGAELAPLSEADTFITTDAGISWRRVKKGRHLWALGDHGSVIVLVPEGQQTKTVSYSLDEGNTWADHVFNDAEVDVDEISTMRAGSSLNFMLWGREDSNSVFTVNLDFSGFSDRVCKHDDKDASASDYYIWSPTHPLQPDGCLFGHVSQYLRKKTDRKCRNDFSLQQLYSERNCTCMRSDFECDYNFELDAHGQCSLVQGLEPQDPAVWCAEHPDAIEYHESHGYRRIPLTTCVDGTQYDQTGAVHSCKDHEDEFRRKHAVSAFVIFLAVAIPVAAAAGLGWYVYRHWDGKFGQIRLGEGGEGNRFHFGLEPGDGGAGGAGRGSGAGAMVLRGMVVIIAGVVAVARATPLMASSVWRASRGFAERRGWVGRGRWSPLGDGSGGVRGGDGGGGGSGGTDDGLGSGRPFTTRDSFARARAEYANIADEDEGELLGEDSDDEV